MIASNDIGRCCWGIGRHSARPLLGQLQLSEGQIQPSSAGIRIFQHGPFQLVRALRKGVKQTVVMVAFFPIKGSD
jgi:hypothetical protein